MGLINGNVAQQWPGGCVPYSFGTLTPTEKSTVQNAINTLNATGSVRLIERTAQSRYVEFMPDYLPLDGVCWSSHTGLSGGRQEVRIDPGAGQGTLIHEICHALGIHHEQKRPDRDNFIMVNYKAMQIQRRSQFDKVSPPAAVTVGSYDLDSIMHYGAASAFSLDKNTRLVSTVNPANMGRIGQRSALSPGDLASLQALGAGTAMVVGLDGQGQIGSVVQMANWSSGWTIASPYAIGPLQFVFLLKTGDGRMHINDVGPNGAIEAIRDNRNWSAGWTTGLAYTRGPQTVLLIYKASSGLLRIHSLTGGAVGAMIEESTGAFGADWTSIAHYTLGASDYLFFLKESSGEMQVHGVGANGGIGQRIQWADWSSGWTIARPFDTTSGKFLFLLKSATGQMHINRIKSDGTIGEQVQTASWTSGWTTALPYRAGNQTFLFLLKSATGQLHINRINADGTIGAITDKREFAPGWATAAIVKSASGPCLLLIKK